ncbi:hypothetical protein BDP27DRAFT_236530 [Rhodocollybia butyracea]|uniref:Uncharacterized protein n=1 Tax=Rhodocollybia butyracea TaxID=206335 RepID=A0A9P5PJY9_9AGAR|nr:hypothetical protein BDP27DRAFT_236530 [Rhodocollybia butyracea]
MSRPAGSNSSSPFVSPVFGAIAKDTLTPGDTVTIAFEGSLSPFAVIFSDRSSGGQVTAVTTVYACGSSFYIRPTGGSEPDRVVSLAIPTLSATVAEVAISYIGGGDSGFFTLQNITLASATATTTTSAAASDGATVLNSNSGVPSPPSATNSSRPISASETSSHHHVSTIIGGTIGAVVGALVLLLALLLWTRRRRRLARPATFHGDRMVKSRDTTNTSSPYFDPFPVAPSRVHHQSHSRGSSRNSSVDGATEKTPVMRVYSRTVSSQYSDDDPEQEQETTAVGGMSEVGGGYTRARTQSRLSAPRTDRQMELEERIHDLQAQMISLSDGTSGTSVDSQDSEIQGLKSKIKQLEELQSSDWALERSNQRPDDLLS